MFIKFSELSLLTIWEWITGRVGGTWARLLKSCTLIMLRTMTRARVSLKQLSMTG